MKRGELTAERARQLLEYDPVTGMFVWRERTGKRSVPEQIAGTTNVYGYRVVTILGVRYLAHRLAVLMQKGRWPEEGVDHVNGRRDDNRWINLREANSAENQQNRAIQKNNRSGLMGVSWDQHANRWRAGIRRAGRSFNLGGYATKEEAYSAYLAAKAAMHPFQPTPRHA